MITFNVLIANLLPALSATPRDQAIQSYQICLDKSNRSAKQRRWPIDLLGISAVSPEGMVLTMGEEGTPEFIEQEVFIEMRCGRKVYESFGFDPRRGRGSSSISFNEGTCNRTRYEKYASINVLGRMTDVGSNISSTAVIDVKLPSGERICVSGYQAGKLPINVAKSIQPL